MPQSRINKQRRALTQIVPSTLILIGQSVGSVLEMALTKLTERKRSTRNLGDPSEGRKACNPYRFSTRDSRLPRLESAFRTV